MTDHQDASALPVISWEDFEKVQLVTGTIVAAEVFPQARFPAYKLRVDIGGGVLKSSSARITHLYTPEELVGKQVICVTNFAPKQIGPFLSEVLVTGFYDAQGQVVLAVPDRPVANGLKLA
jgi:tRNA-binding protein